MARKKGLGRGLDALLGDADMSAVLSAGEEGEFRQLPLELIRRGKYQPRSALDPQALEELARSIRAQGVVQPIVVRPVEDSVHYELIAGERRWRAAQSAGLSEIPAVVRDVPDRAALAIALIENVQREDLNPVEEAKALRRLTEEFEMTHEAAANAVGRSRAAVTNLLRLLDLNEDVRALLEAGEIDMGHARALLSLAGEAQSQAARTVASKGLSARETERLVRRLKAHRDEGARPRRQKDPDVRRMEDELSERLGAAVSIQQGGRGKGKLVIQYTSLDELDGILARIK
ncbi:MAG: ParB/RepB/Spo0J family partition protein [Gammaproteobacteria bacterium]|nr:ParB/RepB/Spo0J family partition protein [Gammaproteobacteria bacterium]NIR83296.1 ParB/RepB/Spo0J family partition protein [Gammaproteobacteria bacterium]NIR91096.1 ParB/RepB/Spo0J family partition protein [Gammaproteobacteria bacterium]NIU04463.1 ParB/RepB/Spo0J family partition protein [Gammaproteobacteria bacterium]NIW87099.1 ParB/RepB/Spo0J family partition protein [Gammaproteobacteria bacterium]